MGEAKREGSSGSPVPNAAPTDFRAWSEDVEVQLGPADVWVLGQLIEAGAASFPPGIAQELMTGYRILKASGYQPPPTRGHTSVGLEATLEEGDEAAEGGAGEPDTGGPVLAREVLVTEVEPGASPDASPDEAVGERGLDPVLVREVVVSEVPGDPTTVSVAGPLVDSAERAGAALDRIAKRLDRLEAGRGATGDRVRALHAAVDLGVAAVDATAAVLLVVASVWLGDPVLAVLGLALLGVAGFLLDPYLAVPWPTGGPGAGEAALERLARRDPAGGLPDAARALIAFAAGAGVVAAVAAAWAGDASRAWGYAGAFGLAIVLTLATVGRVAQRPSPSLP